MAIKGVRASSKPRRTGRVVHGVNIGALVASIKADLRQGVKEGWLPRTVRSFSDVHSYCDANMLGDQSAAHDVACAGVLGDGDREDEHVVDVIGAAQDAVDRWLKQGALAKVGGPRRPRRGDDLADAVRKLTR